MMYYKKFAVAVKVNGKVLREHGENRDEVTLPFGSEYSLTLKNINSIKAQVRVSIDGIDATDGWLVLQPNSSIDLPRLFTRGEAFHRGRRQNRGGPNLLHHRGHEAHE